MLETLIIEDDATFIQMIQRALWGSLKMKVARNLESARILLKENSFDLILLDKHLPDGIGTQLIPEIRLSHPRAAILVLTSDRMDDSVMDALAQGASDYLHKTEYLASDLMGRIKIAQQRVALEHRLAKAEQMASEKLRADMVGISTSMDELRESISIFGRQNVNVLISGETGTGKELVARALNRAWGDPCRPFVALNCGAFSKELIESELFGHVKGSFSGAINDRAGKIEEASGGDLFLDEVGDLPLPLQVKLLRVLANGEYYRVGSDSLRRSSLRVIAASNKDLRKMITFGDFREDLYYRIACAELETTPLRARSEDIPSLVEYFLRSEEGTRFSVSQDALNWLEQQNWPGNVRELENTVKRGIALAKARGSNSLNRVDLLSHQGRRVSNTTAPATLPGLRVSITPHKEGYQSTIDAAKRDYLQKALQHFNGNLIQTAAALDLHLATLYRHLADLNIKGGRS